MQKDDPDLPATEQEQLDREQYQQWRINVAGLLNDAGRWSESLSFGECGKLWGNFQVLVCDSDVTHEARALPFTCHLRYCPDCERRHQAELVAKYTPILKDISEQSDRAGWSLKKIVLSTPYPLDSENADELFQSGWEAFEHWQQLMLQFLLQREMSAGELRRGRIDYRAHGYGSLVAAEFGEHGRKLHFHVLAYMPYLDKHKSSELWMQASGGEASITWLSRIDYHAVEDAVREQVKYVTKFQELPPALVVKLAAVLDGSRRVRTYGTVRGAAAVEPVAHVCALCSGTITVINVQQYFERIIARNVDPDAAILSAAEQRYLDLKRGNKVGEKGAHLARGDPDPLPMAQNLPFFDEIPTKKKPFQYH